MKKHLIIVFRHRQLEFHEDLRAIARDKDVQVAAKPDYWRGMIPEKITVVDVPQRLTRYELQMEIEVLRTVSATPVEVDWRC